MKRLLIVRFPNTVNPEHLKESYEATQRLLGSEYTVLPFVTEVEKTEVEIIYDPHLNHSYPFEFNGEPVNEEKLKERIKNFLFGEPKTGDRQFTQVDTSTNAYMEDKP